MTELPDWLAHRAVATPSRRALEADGRAWTYAELDLEATRVARGLAAVGVGAGDRVATLLRNGAASAVLVHAVPRLGAILVPLNTRLAEAEVAWQLGDAAPRVLLVDASSVTVAMGAARRLPGLQVVGSGAGVADHAGVTPLASLPAADAPLRLAHDTDDVLAILYTSGTTGQPKGAMLTVGNVWWSAVGSALNLGMHADDRWLAALPLFHVGGLSILLRSAIHGTTAVVHDGFDADAVSATIDDGRITIVSLVAVMLQRLLDARGDRPFASSLRCVLLGGGPAPRPLLERCAAVGVPVVQTYGLTETASQVATLAPEDALRKLGAAGRALYPNAVRIAASDGGTAPTGVPGEILVRGPIVSPGYWQRPTETSRAIVDGWLHTGDVGVLDEEGFLTVLDRREDLVVTGGENVYPAEVEAVLTAHAAVVEAAVVGEPDATWGQRVVAVVRTGAAAEPALAEELRAHCRARLAGYKVPREIRLVHEPLPRTASGKLRRHLLRGDAPALGDGAEQETGGR